jgi:DNA-binding MarR family transcriptional regulator
MYNTLHERGSSLSLTGEMIMDNIYEMNGYASRREYLTDLADNMGLDRSLVFALADMLGESEDFDGLVTSLEDISPEDFDY